MKNKKTDKQKKPTRNDLARDLSTWGLDFAMKERLAWEREVSLHTRGGRQVEWEVEYRLALLAEEESRRVLREYHNLPLKGATLVVPGFNHAIEPGWDNVNYLDRNDEALNPGERAWGPTKIIRLLCKEYDIPAAPILRLVPKGDWNADAAMAVLAKELNARGFDTYYSDSRFEVFDPESARSKHEDLKCECDTPHTEWTELIDNARPAPAPKKVNR